LCARTCSSNFHGAQTRTRARGHGEARRLIEQGAIRVNDETVTDPNAKVSAADLKDGAIKLSAGKKRHALIKAG
jgi:tyrosyl-tRNA synthetase